MRRSLRKNSRNNFNDGDGDPRAASVPTSGGHPRRDNHRVRQRPSSSGVCTSTTTVAVMLCSLLGFNLQGFVLANEGNARLMGGTVDPSFFGKAVGSTTRSPRLCSSSSETSAKRNCVVRHFSQRLRRSYVYHRTTRSSAFVLVTSRLNRRPRYNGELTHRILPRPISCTTGDEDPLSSPGCVDSNGCQQQATVTGRHFLQGESHPPLEETSSSRLGFLKHSSVCAVAIVGAASSAVLMLDPPSAADAASAEDSSASKTHASSATQPSKEMVWLDAETGTVSSRLSQADEMYGKGFVAYLARFLLNYDEGCREYFNARLDVLVPKRDGSHVWEEFRGFVASVGLGLHRFDGSRGARILCESLSKKYATPDHEGAAEQLAVLFTLLPPDVQPVAAVKSLLSIPLVRRAIWSAAEHPGTVSVDPSSVLGQGPTELLPAEFRPRYDERTKAFYVPGIPRKLDGDSAELLFGSRGPFPISKERGLSAVDFGLFALCGAIGCTSTHMTVVPLDVVKTRLQTNPGRYEGLTQGVVTIAREEGWLMLLQGIGPTLAGYLWYGITVYPGYELFKRLFIDMVGPLNAAFFRVPLVLAAGATATTFACIGVCPAEAVRIRQVADPSVGDMLAATRQIVAESGWPKLYDGLPSILFRQISFGMMKFLVFDFFTDFVYGLLPFLAERTSTQLSVSLTSGLVAGVCAAIVSQPADTVLSILNRDPGRATIPGTLRSIVEERGIGGLFLGLQSRIVWSGAIISGQFLLYDICKTALHVSASDLKVFLDAISSAGL